MVDIVQNFRWKLNLYLIASIKDIYAMKKCSIESNILNYIKIKVCSLFKNVRNILAINHTINRPACTHNFKKPYENSVQWKIVLKQV